MSTQVFQEPASGSISSADEVSLARRSRGASPNAVATPTPPRPRSAVRRETPPVSRESRESRVDSMIVSLLLCLVAFLFCSIARCPVAALCMLLACALLARCTSASITDFSPRTHPASLRNNYGGSAAQMETEADRFSCRLAPIRDSTGSTASTDRAPAPRRPWLLRRLLRLRAVVVIGF